MSVLVVGESLMDVITARDGSTQERVGGSPLNVAVGLARLSVPTTFATQIGSDPRGLQVREHLAESGVTPIVLDPAPPKTSTASAHLLHDGSATYEFDVTWSVSAGLDVGEFDALHVGSLGAALQPGACLAAELAAEAWERGIPVSFDPNVRLAVEPNVQVWRGAFARIMPYVSYLKMSEEDAQVLVPGIPDADLARMLASETRLVAITCGERGSYVATRSSECWVRADPPELVDTIGAGDSYMAGMLAWFAGLDWRATHHLEQSQLNQLGSFASACAALTCSRPGADPPWTSEILPGHAASLRRGSANAD